MGRTPILHPPGSLKVTCPQRARSGPSKKTEERMEFIRDADSSEDRSIFEFTTAASPSRLTLQPVWRSSRNIASVSLKSGQLTIRLSAPESSVAAKMGSTAFFAPDSFYVPNNRFPPFIRYNSKANATSCSISICAGNKKVTKKKNGSCRLKHRR